ncbi:MAG: protein kinase [Anaerolineaceae bacterium]|nr:protein kinase [Anaerolineaceae bacterium]
MKYICPKCKRVSVDGNQWCQEKHCPAENALEVFDNGEWFSNIEIVERLTVLRSSTIYKAYRDEQSVLLKVAHDGCEERLKREARLLYQLSTRGRHPMFPNLLPAHEQAPLKDFPYSKVVLHGKTRYYEVFEHAEGEILRDMLFKNQQPYFMHVGWLVISLSDAILFMHRAKKLHLGLNPDIVLVRFDKEKIPRPILLDLGAADDAQNVLQNWDHRFTFPSYTAPELINMNGKVGSATDVYGLGLILYELLAGLPAYKYDLQKDEDIFRSVLQGSFASTGRTDLINIPQIAEASINRNYDSRPKDVANFALLLQKNFPPIPKEKKERKINWRTVLIVLGVLLAISMLLILATLTV